MSIYDSNTARQSYQLLATVHYDGARQQHLVISPHQPHAGARQQHAVIPPHQPHDGARQQHSVISPSTCCPLDPPLLV